jgi:GAF domain-containing protein
MPSHLHWRKRSSALKASHAPAQQDRTAAGNNTDTDADTDADTTADTDADTDADTTADTDTDANANTDANTTADHHDRLIVQHRSSGARVQPDRRT